MQEESRRSFVAGFEDILLAEARAAATRSAAATTPRDAGANALTAVILAVASVEALVGTWAAFFRVDYRIDDQTLARWRSRSIHDVVKDILMRLHPPLAVNELKWYGQLCAIYKLRNHVAHYFPEFRRPGTWPPELKEFVQNGTFVPEGDATMDWTSRLLVGSVALQVVGYAAEIQDRFMEAAWKPRAA